MEKTTRLAAAAAHHRPREPCKSQFTVQTPPNNCHRERETEKETTSLQYGEHALIDSATGKANLQI